MSTSSSLFCVGTGLKGCSLSVKHKKRCLVLLDGVTEKRPWSCLALLCQNTGARLHTDLLPLSHWSRTHYTAQLFFKSCLSWGIWVKNLPAYFRLWAHKGRFAFDMFSFLPKVGGLTLNLSEEPPPLLSLILNVTLLWRSAFFRLTLSAVFNIRRKYKSPMIHPRSKPVSLPSHTPSHWAHYYAKCTLRMFAEWII